jgi:hypothetical protein
MDDPNDFDISRMTYKIGDLVRFTGYHYSPDYKFIDEDDYELGLIMHVNLRTFYQPIYTVYWFRNNRTTEVLGEHLTLVVKQIKDYL